MIDRAENVPRDATLRCDVCIIGAGAAGIAIARELAGTKLDVIVLESGLETREEDTQDLYDGTLRGAPQFPLLTSRLRYLGGTTNHWAGMCRPLDPIDFEHRSWVPHSGWPISRAMLDPYYRRAHQVCELGPFDYGPETWGDLVDLPTDLPEDDLVLKLLQYSTPTRFGSRYRSELADAPNIRLFLHANAYELVPAPHGRTIERVEVRTLEGHRFAVAAPRTVVACGGIENPRLLLLSNRLTPAGLGNERDNVGRYFLDHPAAAPFAVVLFMRDDVKKLASLHKRHETWCRIGLSLTDRVLEREQLLNNAVYMRDPMTVDQVRDFESARIDDLLGPADLRMVEYLEGLWREHDPATASICWIRSEQGPEPDSRVLLGDDLDALGQRRVVVDWRLPEGNRHTFTSGARLYARLLSQAGVGRVKLMPWLLESPDDWWQKVNAGWHHMGTTRMASDPRSGVVDTDCRVFGLDNLYIAGSSVFPTSGYINPTLTLVALALRLADHLKQA